MIIDDPLCDRCKMVLSRLFTPFSHAVNWMLYGQISHYGLVEEP